MNNSIDAPAPKSKRSWLISIVAVAIIAGAIGFVISHFLVSRPGDLGARAFSNGGPEDLNDICDRINHGATGHGPGGADADAMSGKMEEYCADGKIDETERAEMEANRPAGSPGRRPQNN